MKRNKESFTMEDVAEYARIRDAASVKGNRKRAKIADQCIKTALDEIIEVWMRGVRN